MYDALVLGRAIHPRGDLYEPRGSVPRAVLLPGKTLSATAGRQKTISGGDRNARKVSKRPYNR